MTPRTGLSIRRVVVNGEDYYPIVDERGRYLQPSEVEALAGRPDPAAAGVVRRLHVVMATEEQPRPPRPGQPYYHGRRLDITRIHCEPHGVPVLHGPGVVGRIELVERTTDRLLATLRLDGTILATLVYEGVARGVLGDVCMVLCGSVDEPDCGRIAWVNIDAVGVGCLPGATVLRARAELDDGIPPPPFDFAGLRELMWHTDIEIPPSLEHLCGLDGLARLDPDEIILDDLDEADRAALVEARRRLV